MSMLSRGYEGLERLARGIFNDKEPGRSGVRLGRSLRRAEQANQKHSWKPHTIFKTWQSVPD